MRIIYACLYPKFWNGTVKKVQTFMPESWTKETIENAITHTINSEKNLMILSNKANLMGKFQLQGEYLGVKVTVGFNNGKIGQFFTR